MNLLLLATEATGEATEAVEAATPGAGLAVWLGIGLLVLFAIAFLVVGPGKTNGPKTRGDIPLAMRPYHSDEELETTGLERAMSWAVALALFIAVFIPLYWIVESDRIEQKKDEFYNEDVELGRALFAANCTTCHGVNAEGGTAPHPDPNVDAAWPAPRLNNIAARYSESNVVNDVEGFIYQTLDQGRPGTPMPAWGSRYAGPMNDQELEVITTYLLAIQTGELDAPDAQAFVGKSGEELYQNNCARCHGVDANGRVGPNLRVVFDQFGANNGQDAAARAENQRQAREGVRYILNNGLYVPTGAIMPSFTNDLTPEAIDTLLDYLASIQVTVEEAGLTALIGQQGLVPDQSAPAEADTDSSEG